MQRGLVDVLKMRLQHARDTNESVEILKRIAQVSEEGALNVDLEKVILANVRTPDERKGDLGAQLAATLRATERLKGLAERYGPDQLIATMAEVMNYSERLMRAALADAAIEPAAIDYVNLHGTATPNNDAAEDAAVHAVFGAATPCSSTKGATGHTLGAAGAVEAAISLLALRYGLIPAGLNLRSPDPALQLNYLHENRSTPLRRVLSNSFGFGGSNASLVFGVQP